MSARVAKTTFFLVLLLAPAKSRGEPAATGGGLALITLAGSQAERAWADQLALQLAARIAALEPMLPDQVRRELQRQLGDQALARSEQRAASAYRAFEAFDDLPTTARRLREAADDHLALLPLLERLDQPSRLLVGLATVELALGHQDEVNRALVEAARLDPLLDLDPQETSPRLAAAARAARQTSSEAPVLTEEQARQLGERLGVRTLVLLQPRPGPEQTRAERYQADSGRRTGQWLVVERDLTALVATLLSSSPRQASPGDPVDGAEEIVHFTARRESSSSAETDHPRRRWYRRWWVWTIVGLAVAGGTATGLVLGLRGQQAAEELPLEVYGHW